MMTSFLHSIMSMILLIWLYVSNIQVHLV